MVDELLTIVLEEDIQRLILHRKLVEVLDRNSKLEDEVGSKEAESIRLQIRLKEMQKEIDLREERVKRLQKDREKFEARTVDHIKRLDEELGYRKDRQEALEKETLLMEECIENLQRERQNYKARSEERIMRLEDELTSLRQRGTERLLPEVNSSMQRYENVLGHGFFNMLYLEYKKYRKRVQGFFFAVLIAMTLFIPALVTIDIFVWYPNSADSPVPQALSNAQASEVWLVPICFLWFGGVSIITSGGEFQEVLRNPPLVVKMWFNILTLLTLLIFTHYLTYMDLDKNLGPWIALVIYVISISSSRVVLNRQIGFSETCLGAMISYAFGVMKGGRVVEGVIVLTMGSILALLFRCIVILHEEWESHENGPESGQTSADTHRNA